MAACCREEAEGERGPGTLRRRCLHQDARPSHATGVQDGQGVEEPDVFAETVAMDVLHDAAVPRNARSTRSDQVRSKEFQIPDRHKEVFFTDAGWGTA